MDLPQPSTIAIGLVIAITILSCLRVIGYEYFNAVRWHNLRVEVHRMRIDQQRRLKDMLDAGNGRAMAGVEGGVDLAGEDT